MTNKKKKFKISGKLIFNVIVFGLSLFILIFFFVSDGGMIDLIRKHEGFNLWWILIAILVYDSNIMIDAVVTLIFLRTQYPDFRFFDALKVAFVGVFFGAVTPSNTGGQPMQLYLLSKKNIGIGFGSSCMTQKFIVFQITSTVFSMLAVIIKFDLFQSAFRDFWSSLFIILGFTVQNIVTVLFLIVSFSRRITKKLVRIIYRIMKLFKFVKNPLGKIKKVTREFDQFVESNKLFMKNKKRLVGIYLLVFLQSVCILSVPYFIYIAFGMPEIAAANGQPIANFFDFICIQSFVLFTSNLVPLPGASGGAEIAFMMYFSPYFVIGMVDKIKPAVLLWRLSTYYGSIVLTAPFSYYTKDRKKEMELANKK